MWPHRRDPVEVREVFWGEDHNTLFLQFKNPHKLYPTDDQLFTLPIARISQHANWGAYEYRWRTHCKITKKLELPEIPETILLTLEKQLTTNPIGPFTNWVPGALNRLRKHLAWTTDEIIKFTPAYE